MIRSATVRDAARLTDLWQAAGLRFHPDLVECELASVLARNLVLVDGGAGELTGTAAGLTALFSRTLAQSGISCNVIAGLAHDHLFVDWDQAARALALLRAL